MSKRPPGIYEALITLALSRELDETLGSDCSQDRVALRAAEAAERLGWHLGAVVRRSLEGVPEKKRIRAGIRLARELVEWIDRSIEGSEVLDDLPLEPGELLRAIEGYRPDGSVEKISSPLIPLLDTTLLTNSPGEPRVGRQLASEIESADRVDVVMAFIRRSGIAPFLAALKRHCERGRPLRFLTTTYTGSTEAAALEALQAAGAEVCVSYDTSLTRLHAKAWLFRRDSGFSTAYIGSSNLTHSAQLTGLEWNVRVSGVRNPDVIEKVEAVFESYWSSGDFVPFDASQFRERTRDVRRDVTSLLPPTELRLEPFQERLLEEIAVARSQGRHRNLLVSATGTGKTVMAAIDYARLRERLPRARLLFVAHRKEILEQSLLTFRHALRDQAFGELWVGGEHPERFDHVFASIQSLNSAGLAHLSPEHFDIVIVDEFHHAAAPSYRRLLDLAQPQELLGLTATPERADGLPVLDWFEGRIAAELRLWDAIDQHRLVPFLYYGIHDGVDLREIPWKRGRGYDTGALTHVLTSSERWARQVLDKLISHADDPKRMRALGFCVSVEHARFMARVFRDAGIEAEAVWADTPQADRRSALRRLADRQIQVLFSVDLFNEGVDLPTVDTLLLLRPTDSPTLFLQQLGRGLRRAPGKAVCTVLDFVGMHRKEFRFDRRFRALLGGSRQALVRQIEDGFPFLPAGCHLELDPVAQSIVLDNIRQALPSRWNAKVDELRRLAEEAESRDVSLATFLQASGLETEDVYHGNKSWSDLREAAGLPVESAGPKEEVLRRACGRLLHVEDPVRIDAWRTLLESDRPPEPATMGEPQRRLLRMLVVSLLDRSVKKGTTLEEGVAILWQHAAIRLELLELLDLLRQRIDHVQKPLVELPDVPLQVHARYTRKEILAAFGVGEGARIAAWQTGVYWLPDPGVDLLAFTLDKTSGGFSPTTRYRDYAINRELIRWESQSTVRAESDTGRRYQEHREMGTHVLLFARMTTAERAFWFLGPGSYVTHQSEKPMAITWKLRHPLPGDLFASFAAALA